MLTTDVVVGTVELLTDDVEADLVDVGAAVTVGEGAVPSASP